MPIVPQSTETQSVPTHYIHDSRLGLTIGYRFYPSDEETEIAVSLAFTHKACKPDGTPSANGPDQFSRRIGRGIVNSRLNSVLNDNDDIAPCTMVLSLLNVHSLNDIKSFNTIFRQKVHSLLNSYKEKVPSYTSESHFYLNNDLLEDIILMIEDSIDDAAEQNRG